MNDIISEVHSRSKKYLAPIVRFERVAVEDHVKSVSSGKFVAKDVEYAFITPPFSKDEVVKKVEAFLADNRIKVQRDQMPPEAAARYEMQYKAWKEGIELPLEGTPIRGWGMISPANQAMLIDRKILTVEMLAQANEDGLKTIGMGAVGMRTMARAWVEQLKDKGPLTIKIADIENENALLKGSVDLLTKQVAALQAVSKIPQQAQVIEREIDPLSAEALFDTPRSPQAPAQKKR